MAAKEFSFDLIRGDTTTITFGITDEEGNPLNLTTGDNIYFTMKKNYKTSAYILQKKWSTNQITYDEEGIATIVLSHTDTASLDYGTYVYDIEVSSGTFYSTTFTGEITLNEEATWLANE